MTITAAALKQLIAEELEMVADERVRAHIRPLRPNGNPWPQDQRRRLIRRECHPLGRAGQIQVQGHRSVHRSRDGGRLHSHEGGQQGVQRLDMLLRLARIGCKHPGYWQRRGSRARAENAARGLPLERLRRLFARERRESVEGRDL